MKVISLTKPSCSRYPDRAGQRVLRVLEGPRHQRHLGPQLHLTHRCKTISRMLCKLEIIMTMINSGNHNEPVRILSFMFCNLTFEPTLNSRKEVGEEIQLPYTCVLRL